MGILLGKTMDENLKKQQEFMLKTSVIQMERQIQMQNQMRERMMAMQIARARDIFVWFGSFYTLASLGMIAGFSKQRKPTVLIPALPLTFLLAYQYDMAYGNKMERMREQPHQRHVPFMATHARQSLANTYGFEPLIFGTGFSQQLSEAQTIFAAGEADRIMDTEGIILALPHGLPTYSSIEAARLDQCDKERLS
ncbi:plasminogen receptor (KT)-like isoform X2 [Haliotis cracherodii]|uniref:plasminogen receptor (KT)-like isoform X2 n=1 Tax=Haliotis cracherodii TaxID=6455 RepID=UPI0039E7C4D6